MCVMFLVYREKSDRGHYDFHADVYKTEEGLGVSVCVKILGRLQVDGLPGPRM